MVTIVVVLSRVDVPASDLVAIDTVVCLVSDEAAPVVLCQVRPVSLLPGFILDVGSLTIFL